MAFSVRSQGSSHQLNRSTRRSYQSAIRIQQSAIARSAIATVVSSRQMQAPLSLDTPVNELHRYQVARLGQKLSARLAQALSSTTRTKGSAEVVLEDLLCYLPMRYEDRSNLARIRDLQPGMEASLELYVQVAGGYQVRNKRSFRQQLYI